MNIVYKIVTGIFIWYTSWFILWLGIYAFKPTFRLPRVSLFELHITAYNVYDFKFSVHAFSISFDLKLYPIDRIEK